MGSFTFWLFIGLLILMMAKPSFLTRFFNLFSGRSESAWTYQKAIAGALISGVILGIAMLILAIAGGYDSGSRELDHGEIVETSPPEVLSAIESGQESWVDYSNILGNLVLPIVILGLAFGIYKKSRVCSVVMFVFVVGDGIFTLWSDADILRLVTAILFGYMFYQGILGTFAYRQMARADYRVSKADRDKSSYYGGFESTSPRTQPQDKTRW